MENKYYVPELEEFHIGFEYEIFINNKWEKKIISNSENLIYFLFESNNNSWRENCKDTIRVKYLDKEDIENILKIKQLKGDEIELNFQLKINDYLLYEFDYDIERKNLIIEKFYQSQLVVKQTNRYNSYTLFHGIVNNISEFKKLFKKLQIDMEAN